jgi:hypothetical protein
MSSRVYTTLIITFLHCTSTTKKNCTQTETIAPNIDIYFSNALTINVTMSLNEPVHWLSYFTLQRKYISSFNFFHNKYIVLN